MKKERCPVCLGPMPPPAATGRPREYCTRICTNRAQMRRRRAAELLEHADRLAELAEQTRRGETSAYGSAEYLDGRAAEQRAIAAELLERLPT